MISRWNGNSEVFQRTYIWQTKRRQFVYVPESDQIEKVGYQKSPDSDIDLSSVLFRQSTHFIH